MTDCPKCGCNDVAAEGTAQAFGTTLERRRCGHCGHRWEGRMEAEERASETQQGLKIIEFQRLRCPYCNSEDVKVQRTAGREKYQLCADCGRTFIAVYK